MGFWSKWFKREASPQEPSSTPPLSERRLQEDFLRWMEARLRKRGLTAPITRDAQTFSLRTQRVNGKEMAISLERIYAQTREMSSEDRVRAVDDFLENAQQLLSLELERHLTWEHAQPRLRPMLGPLSFPAGAMCGHEPLPFLRELIVIDAGGYVSYVLQKDFDSWNVGFAEVLALAHANLARAGAPEAEVYERTPGTIWSLEARGLESSWLLRPGLLASFADKVQGRPIAIVPSRDIVWVAGDAHPETVARLCESAAREYEAATRPVSPALYTVDDRGQVVPYVRASADALAHQVYKGHAQLAVAEYTAQKQQLDDAEGEPPGGFVADAMLLTDKSTGEPSTWCAWNKVFAPGALLPAVELVALRGEEELLLVSWRVLRDIVGPLLTAVPGLSPPRYRTAGWPPPDVIARLRAVALKRIPVSP